MKGIFLIFSITFLLFPNYFTEASMEINEIMYDLEVGSDEGREWVEIFNNSEIPVDFSTFKFFESDVNHKIILKQGDVNIPAKGYAVIVSDEEKFRIDWPNFFGTIFDSSFSLSNSGESLVIKDGEKIIDQNIYKSSLGGSGNGKSLQKINGEWKGAKPTPGSENKISYAPPPLQNESITNKISIEQKENLKENEIKTEKDSEVMNIGVTSVNEISTKTYEIVKNKSQTYISIILFIFLLSGGVGAVYFIRRNKIVPKTGDDFEILDE